MQHNDCKKQKGTNDKNGNCVTNAITETIQINLITSFSIEKKQLRTIQPNVKATKNHIGPIDAVYHPNTLVSPGHNANKKGKP